MEVKSMILAIIQARMSSTRLPGKALIKIKGVPVIKLIVDRIQLSRLIDKIVVATTVNKADDALEEYLKKNLKECDVFRGSEENVLERFYFCAKQYDPEIIVRITADDPLKDAKIIDNAIKHLLKDRSLDYVSNTIKPTFPEGLDVEAFTFKALQKAFNDASAPSEKEHVTPYIWKHPDLFKLCNFMLGEDLSSWRWTLDKPEDLEFINKIYDEFYDKDKGFSYRSVIKYLKENPEVLKINAGTIRNEGYLKSLKEEGK